MLGNASALFTAVLVSQGEMSFTGKDFVTFFAMPNLYFHATTAYDLLREKGVALRKQDYLGGG